MEDEYEVLASAIKKWRVANDRVEELKDLRTKADQDLQNARESVDDAFKYLGLNAEALKLIINSSPVTYSR